MRPLVLCVALLAVVPARAGEAAPENPLSAIAPSSLMAAKERPLFSPSRRAAEAPQPVAVAPSPVSAPPPPPAESPALQLVGVIVGPQGAVAFVRMASDDTIVSLREGQKLGAWTARKIGPRYVEIDGEGGSQRLEILKSNAGDPPAPDRNPQPAR